MGISINRALSELKLLNKKIADKTASLQVAAAVKGKEVNSADFIAGCQSSIDQVNGLITRRNLIKSAIVQSNANTVVNVAGTQMSVAQTIERKTSIELEKDLNRKIREGYYGQKNAVEQHNEQAKRQADKQAEAALGAALGADTEGDKGIQYKAIFDAYFDSNKAELLAPDGIEKTIEAKQDELDEFENEVDFILSESNTKTMIEV